MSKVEYFGKMKGLSAGLEHLADLSTWARQAWGIEFQHTSSVW